LRKYIVLFLLLVTIKLKGQENCPIGYEERNVMCNNKIVTKCISTNQTCRSCWWIKWADCNGSIEHSHYAMVHNSYQECLQDAQTAKDETLGNCPNMQRNTEVYLIYLDNSNACSANIGNSSAVNDFLDKIVPFLQRYRAEIANYRRYFNGEPYNPGAIYREYQSLIRQAETNAGNFSLKLDDINANNLKEIESQFDNIKDDEAKLIQVDLDYKAYLSSSQSQQIQGLINQINSSQNSPNNSNADPLSQSLANIQILAQINKLPNNATKRQLLQQLNNIELKQKQALFNEATTSTLELAGSIMNVIIDNRNKKIQETEKENQRISEQLKMQRAEKQEEESRNANIDIVIAGDNINSTLKKPLEVTESNIQTIYYVAWCRAYQSDTVYILAPFALTKYSDGTWPFYSETEKKIDGILYNRGANRSSLPIVYGYFINISKASNVYENLKLNAISAGLIIITAKEAQKDSQQASNKTGDFWNN
jgi:hypothetical protein